ncbi:unnamed protein product, partial [Rotaria sp. Silwood1]
DYSDDEIFPSYTVNLIINDLSESGTVSTNLVDAAMTDIYANSIPLSTTPLITSINDYSTTITQEIYQQLKGDASDIAARKRWWVEKEMASKHNFTVAVLGLGAMGSGIAENMLKNGYKLVVWNRTQSKTKALVDAGSISVATPREAAQQCDVIISCLFDDKSVFDIVQGENGLLAGIRKDSVHISTTTISPMAATQLTNLHQEKGVHYISGPVLGRPDVAAAGKLRTFLSGSQTIIDSITTIIECYCGGGLIYVGEDSAHACVMKLSANLCVASIIDMYGQIYALNEGWKVSTDITKQLFSMLLTHPGILAYSEKVRNREYTNPGGVALRGGLKDINLMLQMGEEVGVPLPFVNVIHDHIVTAIGNGLGEKDWSAFAESARLNSGMQQKE